MMIRPMGSRLRGNDLDLESPHPSSFRLHPCLTYRGSVNSDSISTLRMAGSSGIM